MTHPLPLVTAHSGCENTPENSLESMVAGIAAGADTVEIDVRATRDGTPILMHDPYVLRKGTDIAVGELEIHELNSDGADNDPASSGRRRAVTALEQALELIGSYDVTVNLDVKDDLCIEGVVRLIRRHDLCEMVVLTGCPPARADILRSLAPELPVLLNAEAPPGDLSEGDYSRFVDLTCQLATRHHCCGINVAFHECRPELMIHGFQRYLPISV